MHQESLQWTMHGFFHDLGFPGDLFAGSAGFLAGVNPLDSPAIDPRIAGFEAEDLFERLQLLGERSRAEEQKK
jgi:hypothetical protein